MPLSESAPCSFCLRELADEINAETLEPIGIANVILSEVTPSTRTCVKCIRHFCPLHASPVDQSDCCFECLPFEAAAEMKTPLVAVDDDGNHVLRKGHRLVPTGAGYKTLPNAIANMSDPELEAYITEKTNQLHFVEKQKDYLMVARSTAKLEQGERDDAKRRALHGYQIKVPIPPSNIKITGKANGAIKGIAGGTSANINIADFLKFAAANLAKIRAAKASPAPAVVPPVLPTHAAAQPKVVAPGVIASPVTKPQGGGVSGVTPPPAPQASPVEQAREAEIERILEGGEPK